MLEGYQGNIKQVPIALHNNKDHGVENEWSVNSICRLLDNDTRQVVYERPHTLRVKGARFVRSIPTPLVYLVVHVYGSSLSHNTACAPLFNIQRSRFRRRAGMLMFSVGNYSL